VSGVTAKVLLAEGVETSEDADGADLNRETGPWRVKGKLVVRLASLNGVFNVDFG
jgi:hypothetical protein